MKKHLKSIRLMPIILSLILAMALGLSGCITINPPETPSPPATPEPVPPPAPAPTSIPAPPDIPQEVLSIWKAEPVSGAYPPDISEHITLLPNLASGEGADYGDISLKVIATEGSWQNSLNFNLQEGQWLDVIASSTDTQVYFGIEKPDSVCFKINYDLTTQESVGSSSWDYNGIPKDSISAPLYGKTLYENWVINTDEGRMFTTSARLFAWEGAGNYYFDFTNFSSQEGCEITYCVYKYNITPGWGKLYIETKLQPWLNDLYYLLVSGEITEEEYDKAEREWLEQFE